MELLGMDLSLVLASFGLASIRTLVAFTMLPMFAAKLVPGIARGGLAMAIVLPVAVRVVWPLAVQVAV